jgi:hypothetical protein
LKRQAVMSVLGIHTNGIDDTVYPDPAGQIDDGLDRVLLVEVDDFGALLPGHFQPIRMLVDRNDAACPHQAGTCDRELPDRPAAEDGHC